MLFTCSGSSVCFTFSNLLCFRISGPGTLHIVKGNPFLAMTANCTTQLYTNVTSSHGVYAFTASGATSESKVHVGYSATGPKGISLVSAAPTVL